MKKLKTVSIGHPFHIEMLRTLSAMAAIWAKASGWGVSPTLSESQAADKCKQPWRILVWWQNTTSSYLTKLWSKRFYTHYSLYFYLTCFILFLLCDPSCRWLLTYCKSNNASKSKASTLWLDAFWCRHLHCWPRCTSRGNITGSFLRADQSSPQGTSEMHGNYAS